MKIREIMTPNPISCHADTNLAAIAGLMWEHNCGALPVLNDQDCVIGMITDRDICIALGTSNRRAAETNAGQVIAGKVVRCNPDADIGEALSCLQSSQVRRLIVSDDAGRVQGIVSIDDIIRNVQWSETRQVDLSLVDVIRALRKITHSARSCATA